MAIPVDTLPPAEPSNTTPTGQRVQIPIDPPAEKCYVSDASTGAGTTEIGFAPCNGNTWAGEVIWPSGQPPVSMPEVAVAPPPVPVQMTELPATGGGEVAMSILAAILISLGMLGRRVGTART